MSKFYMMIGLVGSGKSYYASSIKNANIHSSDSIREELSGDVNNQDINELVFKTLHHRIKTDLKDGKNVVYDACNISYKRRMSFLQEISKIKCEKIAIFVATPYEKCLEQNRNRDRVVPEYVIKRMYLNFDIPAYFESWDEIKIVYNDEGFKFDKIELFSYLNKFNQDNPHHSLTLGHHCTKTMDIVLQKIKNIRRGTFRKFGDFNIVDAGLCHDIGKVFSKKFENGKGEKTETASYLQHHHVSAYLSVFYLKYDHLERDILDIAQLIRWHMYPYKIQLAKTREKLIRLVGQEFYDRLMILHEADKLAH